MSDEFTEVANEIMGYPSGKPKAWYEPSNPERFTQAKDDLTLDNHEAPPADKNDPAAFRPQDESARLRQAIYARLKGIIGLIPVCVLSLDLEAREVRVKRACRQLVRAGLIERGPDLVIPTPTKRTPHKEKRVIQVRYLEHWKSKTKTVW